jgi:hypothetical protein
MSLKEYRTIQKHLDAFANDVGSALLLITDLVRLTSGPVLLFVRRCEEPVPLGGEFHGWDAATVPPSSSISTTSCRNK